MSNSAEVRVEVRGEQLLLSPERVMYHEKTETLIVSDLHLGKGEHFRKNGIAVPAQMIKRNLVKLERVIERFQPREVLMLGDVFHSIYNKSWEVFAEFVRGHQQVAFTLVEGNHDILSKERYADAGIELLGLVAEREPFLFIHDMIDNAPDHLCVVSGHIHPAIKLYGKGMQSLVLPCFVVSEDHIVMPAFGAFTGLAKVSPTEADRIFAIAEGSVVEVTAQKI